MLTDAAPEFDLNMVNTFYNRYLNETQNGSRKWQNITMKLDTSEVRGHIFKTRVKMSWPSLLADRVGENKTVFNFPLTQVGNVTYKNISLKNPSSYNLVIQIVLDTHYPGLEGEGLYEGLSPNLISHDLQKKKKPSTGFFLHESYKRLQEDFISKVNLEFHKETIPVLLKPGENITFSVGFKADEPASSTAALFLRNNLTILEILKLNAKASYPSFKFGNRKPGSSQPLSFELTEKHLKDCEREKHRKYPSPNLTVKRSFTARNTGDITVYVKSFIINEMPCEGYGFRVLNCEAFYLLPNATRKIDIAFTPDFTLAKITRTLVLETSLNLPVNYTLVTTIPPYYLSLCSTVILRPAWEAYMYYTAVCLMCFLLVFVVLAPVMDSERIIKQALGLVITRSCPSTQPTLDLRLVGQQTRNEIRQKVEADVVEQKNKCTDKTCSKICSLMDEPTKPVKQEPEKQTVLVPTVGKQKKKVAKRISNELNEAYEKKNSPEPQKVYKTSNKQTETMKTDVVESDNRKHSPKEHRKIAQNKKVANKSVECSIKPADVPVCEEETSSTTTESSNNEEDKLKVSKPVILKKQISSKTECNSVAAAAAVVVENIPTTSPVQVSPEPIHHHTRIERKRSGSKPNKTKDYLHERNDKSNIVEGKTKSNRNARERKEKQALIKKLSKPTTSNSSTEYNPPSMSPPIRTSPSIPSCSFWSENKATFSDIVARTENNSYPITTTRSSYTQPTTATITKPTVYVEPYKQTNSDLGPIGSRKIDFWQDTTINNRNDDYNQIPNSNSFFTDTNNLNVESSDPFLDFSSTTDNWEQSHSSSSLLDLMRNNILCSSGTQSTNTPLSGIFLFRCLKICVHLKYLLGTWTASNGHWDTPFTQTDDAAARTSQSGFLWGSSSVWQPLIPQPPKSPPRTPPGFMPQHEIDEVFLHNVYKRPSAIYVIL